MSKSNGQSANGHKRAVLVARVSKKEQSKGYSLPTQVEAMREYCAEHGLVVIEPPIEDTISGETEIRERPGGARLYEMIGRREMDAVIFYVVDRVARDEDMVEFPLLIRSLKQAGLEMHTCNYGKIDYTDTAMAIRLFLDTQKATQENKTRRERTMRGLRAKAAAGKWIGSGRPPYGYMKRGIQRESELLVDNAEAAIVRRIFDLCIGSPDRLPVSLHAIGRLLNAEGVTPPCRGKGTARGWWRSTLREILRSRAYLGEFSFGGHAIPLPDLAIINLDTWQAAQDRLNKNKRFAKRNRANEYLLTGYMRCTCNMGVSGYSVTPHGVRYLYYRCNSYNDANSTCRERYVRADIADRLVWDWLSELLKDEARLLQGLRRKAQRDAEQHEGKRERLATVCELITETQASLKGLAADLAALKDVAEIVREVIRAQVRDKSDLLTALTTERDRLQAELARVELTPEVEARILEEARRLRAGMGRAKFATKQFLLDKLGFAAQLRVDDAGRWLDCSCALEITPQPLLVESYTLAGTVHNYKTQIVVFSGSIPLDGQPVGNGALAEALFGGAMARQPALVRA